ncbi:hypothetical protein [Granulosicoccus antarcticus]|uniref:Uncharacterized protein n=1 Tax=Granulosicoccus antarcticus IMCC3135 TaxID=1192854 RepID=A0A2Z2P0Z5_9GAMM|nr:hypothetical protein [Granulosicoccus antarcticus]ASJ76465.1 hypothetical protein IMCC3135_32095 [Granulosicoccus antarcticus IMCC3135]
MTSIAETKPGTPVDEPPSLATSDEAKPDRAWVQTLADIVSASDLSLESRLRTSLSCDITARQPTFYFPPKMAELQPRNFRYLQCFAKKNGFKLLEDRRNKDIQPILERRDRKPAMVALGLSLLMKQTGIPGAARIPSVPHRLNPDSQYIGLGKLIKMAAFATPNSKRVVVLPNRILVNALKDTQPISGHACNMTYAGKTTILSHFDSQYFRSIGYSTGSQYVTHICLAGGPRELASLWTQLPTLTNTDFKLQLFPATRASEDFGLFYITLYLNMAKNPSPWWLESDTHKGLESDTHKMKASNDSHTHKHRKTG